MEFDVALKPKDMVRFNFYHSYTKFISWLAPVLAVVAFVLAGYAWTTGKAGGTMIAIYILLGLFVLIYPPVNTYLAPMRRIKMVPEVLEPLHYQINEQGITVSREENSAELPWDQIFRFIHTKNAFYIYSSRVQAHIIPAGTLTPEQEKELIALAETHLEKSRLKL